MLSQIFKDVVQSNQGTDASKLSKQIFLFCGIYTLISIVVRFFVRDFLFRAGIYEEWFIDITTIGPAIQGLLVAIGIMHYATVYGAFAWSGTKLLKSILLLGVALSLFRWFIVLILGGGFLVLLDLQDHGIVQNYVEEHFIVDLGALLIDFIMLRYLYKLSSKNHA